jgi:hypothetical protein
MAAKKTSPLRGPAAYLIKSKFGDILSLKLAITGWS